MKLTVLGKYGPFPPKNSATSGYLLQSSSVNVLLDVGAGVYNNLTKFIEAKDLNFIVLSHLHFDHISDIGVLSYALNFTGFKGKMNVYLPKSDSVNYKMLESISVFNLIPIEEGVRYSDSGLEFEFFEMTHPVKAYAVKVYGDKTFAYTGDTTFNDNLKNLAKNADFLVADGAFLESDYNENKPHMSIKQAGSLSKFVSNKLLVSHLSYNYSDSEVENEIKDYKIVEVAKENKTYNF
jgi:ribonuclease BN (tRNA processing enzyme)